ncbi:MAG: secretin N-terminal domain-containing protein [Parachlamydiaceae bacterium]|nr:secretin N-terminal domain-containing protein [Parachlamydiaceae bacterium]
MEILSIFRCSLIRVIAFTSLLQVIFPLPNKAFSDSSEYLNENEYFAQLTSLESDASFDVDPSLERSSPNPESELPIQHTDSNPAFQSPSSPNVAVHPKLENVGPVLFNNISMIEYVRFISRISNKNFIFDEEDLQFNVTIVSEEPTSVENLTSALLQELKIRDLSLIEEGNNILIHRNPRVKAPYQVVSDDALAIDVLSSEIITRVFRLNTLDPAKASEIIRPLLSADALVEVLRDSNNLIITDLVTNVNKIAQLIGTLDSPNTGITIGQYVVKNSFIDSLVELALKIIQPIAQGNPFTLVPHTASDSIYIVSNGFIVEKALAILQNLDLNEGRTKMFSLEKLYPTNVQGFDQELNAQREAEAARELEARKSFLMTPNGFRIDNNGYLIGPDGRPVFPGTPGTEGYPVGPNGHVMGLMAQGIGPEGISGGISGPNGSVFAREEQVGFGGISSQGSHSAIFEKEFQSGTIGSSSRISQDLPMGHIERTVFSIYKLRYRRGDQIEIALRKIAFSLEQTGTANIDLLTAINSVQWIESTNAIIITGTPSALSRVRELIAEVDAPLRQVFIECLILQTTIRDSLEYAVTLDQAIQGNNLAAFQGFNGNVGQEAANAIDFTTNPPSSSGLESVFGNLGYTAAVIGTHITHHGTRFNTIAALVKALHSDEKTKVMLNPKVITEDNNTAEFFVGTVDRYKTQSITNDLGTLVTNNFQFIEVGTSLLVTPLIGNDGLITLTIEQETSTGDEAANFSPGGSNATATTDVNLVPVISKSRTATRFHVPNGFFVVISGMIQDSETRALNQVPCLGGIPILGFAFKQKANSDIKTTLMIFIRPLIVDTEEELEDLTRRQQDIYREKSKHRRAWNYEIDEALDSFNIKPTDPDEIGCNER